MLAWFDRHFSLRLPRLRRAGNALLLSLAGLLAALTVYVGGTPGFAAHLLRTEGALAPLLRQLLGNGLPVVLAVNGFGLSLFARLRAGRLRPGVALGFDALGRIGGLAALHAAVFLGAALAFGAFGGVPSQALGALGPTLERAAGFGNLAGVYLYATLPAGLAVQVAALSRLLDRPGRSAPGPVRLLLPAFGLVALQLLALTALGRALTALL